MDLLTVREFGLSLRVKESCVRRWILERKITTVRVGRLVRVPRSEVERIIAEGTCPAKGVS
jgi:excisionase family DNA binding protein